MKTQTIELAALIAGFLPLAAAAGTNDAGGVVAPTSEPDAIANLLTPTIDLRTRYEFRDQQGSDASHALTVRARVGLLLGDLHGISVFGEAEGTRALIDDYRSNPAGQSDVDPYERNNTVIGDPENLELNRAWVRYEGGGFDLKLGRQRIIRNNAALVGNVGWRQNEQTYDAATISYGGGDRGYEIFYGYSDQANRIFGDDASGALKEFTGDFHLLDASLELGEGTLGAYAYLLDVDNNAKVGRANTFGIHYASGPVYLEAAYQDGSSMLADRSQGTKASYDAFYGHATYTRAVGANGSFVAGVEYLGRNFKTPLATVHKFNGFADAFTLQRIGLNDAAGEYDGLADPYLGYTQGGLPGGLVVKGFVHYFADASLDDSYGWESDLVIVKKFNEHVSGLVKLAYFFGNGEGTYANDIAQASFQLDCKF